MSDPIAEFITRIRNAKMARHRYVDVPSSKMRKSIAQILHEKGFIDQFLMNDEKRKMRIFLKYSRDRSPIIQDLKRMSMPGMRRYLGYQEIPRVCGGLGIAILSTSKGVMEGERARQEKVGGEILCLVW